MGLDNLTPMTDELINSSKASNAEVTELLPHHLTKSNILVNLVTFCKHHGWHHSLFEA